MSFKLKILSGFLLCFVALFLILSGIVFAQEQFPFVAETIADEVHIRAGQSLNFESLLVLPKGQTLIVLDKKYSWYKVELLPSAASFIAEQFIMLNPDQSQGVVTGDRVNVRARADIKGTVLAQASKGETVKIAAKQSGWYQILPLASSVGWVSEDLVKFVSAGATNLKNKNILPAVSEMPVNLPTVTAVALGETEPTISPAVSNQDEAVILSVPKTKSAENVSSVFIGVLNLRTSPEENIYYQVTVDGKPVCYIFGLNELLNRFEGFTVKVQGEIVKSLSSKIPVIDVESIRLQL